MKNKNIALIGFMGVGKTLVSNKLEKMFDWSVISTDQEITQREGIPITEIFKLKGEKYFRELEKKVVKEVCARENVIIDCGGGVILDDENFNMLANTCHMICIDATADTIFQNISHRKDRPLLNVPDPKAEIARLLKAREPFYIKCEYHIDGNNKTVDQMADDIQSLISKLED